MRTSKENTFTSIIYHTWYDKEVCQSYGPWFKGLSVSAAENFHQPVNPITKKKVLVCSQIIDLMKKNNFAALLKGTTKAAWKTFQVVVDNCLGKHKASNYRTHVDTTWNLQNYGMQQITQISLPSQSAGLFPSNFEEVSDEHGGDFTKISPS